MTRITSIAWLRGLLIVPMIGLVSLSGCNGRGPEAIPAASAREADETYDAAIVTVIAAEYEAILAHMDRIYTVDVPEGRSNTFAWTGAEIDRPDAGEPVRVIVALAGEAGTTSGALAVIETARTWQPDTLLLAGIAGGIEPQVRRGDVVISNAVWGYEYGAIAASFTPRYDWIFKPDPALAAEAAAYRGAWQDDIRVERPDEAGAPTQVTGITASGNKVIETLDSAYIEGVFGAMPGIVSVEMEAAGSFAAAEVLREDADPPRFLMLRGISDVPNPKSGLFGDKKDRERWKRYASDSVAAFTVNFLRDRQWVSPSRNKSNTDLLVVTYNDLVFEDLDASLGGETAGIAVRRLQDKRDLKDLDDSLAELNPKAVLLVDTALGIGSTSLGDVIASRLNWPYEFDDQTVDARMDAALRSSRAFVAAVQAIEGTVFPKGDESNVLKSSSIASNGTLPDWNDEETIKAVSGHNPRTAMIDEESWMVANHLYERTGPRLAFVSIQAAEQVAGSPEVDPEVAAANAARVAIELVRERGD